MKGKPSTSNYGVATLFVDHASRFLHLSLHCSTGAQEAIEAKHKFERAATEHGVTIKEYHADNGVYQSKLFRASCDTQNQKITFCGVNAHHQNGIAERQIRTLTERARTMLIHSMHRWPEIVTAEFWPFALKMATDVHNAAPTDSGLSPEEIFTGKKSRNKLEDFHTFGCPVFVLEAALQQENKIPKWQPRSRLALYFGHSPNHAQTVPLVLNICTGLVSP